MHSSFMCQKYTSHSKIYCSCYISVLVHPVYSKYLSECYVYRTDMNANHKSCEDSWYGCCPDGKTAALGANNAGCPSMCGCNKLGKLTILSLLLFHLS